MAASDWAFAHNGAEVVTAEVMEGNPGQVKAYSDDSDRGFPFRYAGRIWHSYEMRLFSREKPEPAEDHTIPACGPGSSSPQP